jgi:hypothetical protein
MTCDDGVHGLAVIRQAVHDAVRALLTAPPDSLEGFARASQRDDVAGRRARRRRGDRPGRGTGRRPGEAFEALAAAENRPALAVLDGWFHDIPPPRGPATAEPFAAEPDVTSSSSQSTLRVVVEMPGTRASQAVWHCG